MSAEFLYIEHVTSEGERWDQIADRHYGDPLRVEPIIAANPEVPIVPILGSGLVLRIPLLEEGEIAELIADLPPWKRVEG